MEFIFKIEPQPKRTGSISTFGKYPVLLKNKRTRQFEASINAMCREMYKDAPLDCPLAVEIKFFLSKPKSVKRDLPCIRPDLSNCVKAIEDGCNGILWRDDSLICSVFATKEYSTSTGFIVLKVQPIR